MASGKEIHHEDLPPELKQIDQPQVNNDWEETLRSWVEMNLVNGQSSILADAVPRFERIMIETALKDRWPASGCCKITGMG